MKAMQHIRLKFLLVCFDWHLNDPPSKTSNKIQPTNVNAEVSTKRRDGVKRPRSMYTNAATNIQTLNKEIK